MKTRYDAGARKRPVNLSLNEDLVSQARQVTDNLSGVVESLLGDFVAKERSERLVRSKALEETVAAWNAFGAAHGSIADEYSTL